MSLKFRKRIKACPGVRVNISRSGFSTTFGVPGFSVNFGKRGTYLNLGIPGTGIYDRIRLDDPGYNGGRDRSEELPFYTGQEEIRSTGLHISSPALGGLRQSFIGLREEGERTQEEVCKLTYLFQRLQHDLKVVDRRMSGFSKLFLGKASQEDLERKHMLLQRDIRILEREAAELQNYVDALKLPIFTEWKDDTRKAWDRLTQSFQRVIKCEVIWDITTERQLSVSERVKQRTRAGSIIDRHPTCWLTGSQEYLLCPVDSLILGNVNGPNLYVYPFFIFVEGKNTFLDIRDLQVHMVKCHYTEQEVLPNDAKTDGYTWAKVNKDGSRDRRFNGNYQIPVALYGEIELSTRSGLREVFMFSDIDKAHAFYQALRSYLDLFKTSSAGPKSAEHPDETTPPLPKSQPAGDPYQVLGVARDASMDEITKVYRSLAKIYHGDSSTPGVDEAWMVRINDAYERIEEEKKNQ
jgi:hypothetical protein